jgi:CIC family chloride channel protein
MLKLTERSYYLSKLSFGIDERLQLIIIGAFVGLCSGLASSALNFSLTIIADYLGHFRHFWYSFLFPACGATFAVLFLRYIIKERGGHGVPEVIYSISRGGGFLKLRSSISRLVACLLTIASGGSAGPEAPIVISGASIGSNIAGLLYLKERHRVILVGCGAAGAIAAIFNAPVTGIVFTLEIIVGEWTAVNLIPIAIASVVGTEVSRFLNGNQIPFQSPGFETGLIETVIAIGIPLFTAAGAVFFIRFLRFVSITLKNHVSLKWLRAATGGVLVGLIGTLFPVVLGEGYHSIRTIIEQRYTASLLIILLTIIAKIMATSFTVGSGGSGGVFAPSLFIGSLIGKLYGRIMIFLIPSVVRVGDGYFALLGMAGVISSVLQAPLTAIFLIIEITGSYQLLVPVVLVSVLSSTFSNFFEHFSIYHHELIERGELLRPRTDQRILAELDVMELLEKDCPIVKPDMYLEEFIEVIKSSRRNYFAVVNPCSGNFEGLINLNDIRAYLFDTHLYTSVMVGEIIDTEVPTISPNDELTHIMELFEAENTWSLPVVQDGKFLGLISKATILDLYRRELLVQGEL